MSKTNRNIAIGCGAGCLLIVVLLGVAVSHFYKTFISPVTSALTMSAELQQPGVKKGVGFLTRREFASFPRFDFITDLQYGNFDGQAGEEIAVVGYQGVVLLDKDTGKKKSESQLNLGGPIKGGAATTMDWDTVVSGYNGSSLEIVPYQQSYLLMKVTDKESIALLDKHGKELWLQYLSGKKGQTSKDDGYACAGDVNGDGLPEVAISENSSGKIRLYDKSGKEHWQQKGAPQVYGILMVDTNGDGKEELITGDESGKVVIYDQTGKIIKHVYVADYYPDNKSFGQAKFSLYQQSEQAGLPYLLTYTREMDKKATGKFLLIGFDGKLKQSLKAPDLGVIMIRAKGVPVKLVAGQPEYTAILAAGAEGMLSISNIVLSIYDSTGKLVYQEVLDMPGKTIIAVPSDQNGTESLLLGMGGKVVAYSAASIKNNKP